MQHQTRIREIATFLHTITPIWQDEILHSYPKYKENYPKSWVQELSLLTEEELYLVDSRQDYSSLKNHEFKEFINSIQKLCHISAHTHDIKELPSWAFHKVKEKKRHEIATLASYIGQLQEKYPINQVVDIGGGVGHLARILAFYYQIDATSIDQDLKLQIMGKARLKKYPKPDHGKSVQFINAIFGEESKEKKIQINEKFKGNVLTIGLHTCGPLAIRHMQRSLEQKSLLILNFGCCYNKLDSKKEVNLSRYSKELNIKISGHALTLATRGHNKMSHKDYLLKKNVKKFRYTLHLLLKEKFNIFTFVTVGEASSKAYNCHFSDYALKKLKILNIEHGLMPKDLDNFFNRSDVQDEVRYMFLCNIIRWQLGRVMELYLLLDRVLWLNENNYDANINEYFNSSLSPRNIGITAKRTHEGEQKSVKVAVKKRKA